MGSYGDRVLLGASVIVNLVTLAVLVIVLVSLRGLTNEVYALGSIRADIQIVTEADPTPILEPSTPAPFPTDNPTATLQPTATPKVLGITHEVEDGDTLCGIAALYYGDCRAWQTILDANPQLPSRNHLREGQELFVPSLMEFPTREPTPKATKTPQRDTPDTSVPLRGSAYTLIDLGIPDKDNPNCNDNCKNLSLTEFSPRLYGNTVACHRDWIGQRTVEITIPDLGVFYCLDTGGLITKTERIVSGYNNGEPLEVYETDFLCNFDPRVAYPWFHGMLFYDWSYRWVQKSYAIEQALNSEGVC